MKNQLIIGIIILIVILFIWWFSSNNDNINNDDINNKVTICVKTLYRSKAIGKFVKDTRKILPYIKIIIADDSDDEYKIINQQSIQEASPNDSNIIYIPLPYDIGVSQGRNECVKRVKTPYTIITDDTRTINNADNIYKLVDYLDKNKQYDMITGHIPERYGTDISYTNLFKSIYINNKKIDSPEDLKLIDNLDNKIDIKTNNINQINNDGYYITDIGVQSFIARTNILIKYPWNDNLKMHEHIQFFLKLWANDINILYDKYFIFNQMNKQYRTYDKNGNSLRNRDNLFQIINLV